MSQPLLPPSSRLPRAARSTGTRGFLRRLWVGAFAAFVGALTPTQAAVKHATPADYRRLLATLEPGDTLVLAAGVYERGLPVSGRHGTPEAWITIQGPEKGVAEIRQTQEANCVELWQCSHLALKGLHILGGGPSGIPGLFGISAKGGVKNPVHHIVIENCVISGWNTSQQAVGISTKAPAWAWTIRGNTIRDCGTGLYLGNSTGADPFIGGIIENNLVENPVGYCMEIKYQNPRPALAGMPTTASRTIIRNNVFIKNDAPSPDGNRANLLVGGFPETGPGSEDWYEIHGNLLWHNPRESLLQVSGRVLIHDNLFVDCPSPQHAGILARDHDLPLKAAYIYNNTFYGVGRGIRMTGKAPQGHAVAGNAIFGKQPLALDTALTGVMENIIGPMEEAARHLTAPSLDLQTMDLHPRAGQCMGPPLTLPGLPAGTAGTDFDGRPAGARAYRGAYAGPGANPGKTPARALNSAPSR